MAHKAAFLALQAWALLILVSHGLKITYPNASVATIDISTPLHIRWIYDSNDPDFVNLGLQCAYIIDYVAYDKEIETPGHNISTKDQHYMVDWQQSTEVSDFDIGMQCSVVIYIGRPLYDRLLDHSPFYFLMDGGEANGDPLASSSMTITMSTTMTATVPSTSQEDKMTATVAYGTLNTKSGPYVIATASTKTLSFDVPGQDPGYDTMTSPPAPPSYTSFLTYDNSAGLEWTKTQTEYNLTSLSECISLHSASYQLCTASQSSTSSTPMGTVTFSVSSGQLVPAGQSPTTSSGGEDASMNASDSGSLAATSVEASEGESTITETKTSAASTSAGPSRTISTSKAAKGKKVPALELICAFGMMAGAIVIVLIGELLSLGRSTVVRRY